MGDGPTRPILEKRLGPAARFAGYRKGDDLADHYAASDIFAFSSLSETFGNVVLEAMASGLPVVAVASRRRRRDRSIGDDGDAGGTVGASRALCLGTDLSGRRSGQAARDGEAARSYALSQSWDAIMGSLRHRYQAVVEQQAGRPSEQWVSR